MARFLALGGWNGDLCSQFTDETGITFPVEPKTGLDAMIDQATGYATDVAFRFAVWATQNYFGMDNAPAAFREASGRLALSEEKK